MSNNATITFRLPESEKMKVQKQADKSGMSVGEWIRMKCVLFAQVEPDSTVASVFTPGPEDDSPAP